MSLQDKLTVLKEQLIKLHYNSYQYSYDVTWEHENYLDTGFIRCASIFLSIDEMKECENNAWNRYMTDGGYTLEEADEIKKQAIEHLEAGIGYLQENPNATFLDLEKGDV